MHLRNTSTLRCIRLHVCMPPHLLPPFLWRCPDPITLLLAVRRIRPSSSAMARKSGEMKITMFSLLAPIICTREIKQRTLCASVRNCVWACLVFFLFINITRGSVWPPFVFMELGRSFSSLFASSPPNIQMENRGRRQRKA